MNYRGTAYAPCGVPLALHTTPRRPHKSANAYDQTSTQPGTCAPSVRHRRPPAHLARFPRPRHISAPLTSVKVAVASFYTSKTNPSPSAPISTRVLPHSRRHPSPTTTHSSRRPPLLSTRHKRTATFRPTHRARSPLATPSNMSPAAAQLWSTARFQLASGTAVPQAPARLPARSATQPHHSERHPAVTKSPWDNTGRLHNPDDPPPYPRHDTGQLTAASTVVVVRWQRYPTASSTCRLGSRTRTLPSGPHSRPDRTLSQEAIRHRYSFQSPPTTRLERG